MLRPLAVTAVSLLALSSARAGTVRVVNRSLGTWVLASNPLSMAAYRQVVIQPGEAHEETLAPGESARFLLEDPTNRSCLDLAFACTEASGSQTVQGEVICTEPHATSWAPGVVEMGAAGPDLEVALRLDAWPVTASPSAPSSTTPLTLDAPPSPALSPATSEAVERMLSFRTPLRHPDAPVNLPGSAEAPAPAAAVDLTLDFALEPAMGATHVFAQPGRSLLDVTEATLASIPEE